MDTSPSNMNDYDEERITQNSKNINCFNEKIVKSSAKLAIQSPYLRKNFANDSKGHEKLA